jgi:hypothetical protein
MAWSRIFTGLGSTLVYTVLSRSHEYIDGDKRHFAPGTCCGGKGVM